MTENIIIAQAAETKVSSEPFKSNIEHQNIFVVMWNQLLIMLRRNTILQYRCVRSFTGDIFNGPFVFDIPLLSIFVILLHLLALICLKYICRSLIADQK